MKHAREDYNRIQDPAGLIPVDEPVFILRGQDKYAAKTVDFYSSLVQDIEIKKACTELAKWMRDWGKHKEPDLPKENI